jgi:glutaredoxin 3
MSDGGKGSSPRPFGVDSNTFERNWERTFGKKENTMTAIVWSKNQCPYCVQAKALLTQKGIEFEERNIEQDWTREQLLEAVPTARTLPQIFINNTHIGGFTELRKHLENT